MRVSLLLLVCVFTPAPRCSEGAVNYLSKLVQFAQIDKREDCLVVTVRKMDVHAAVSSGADR